MDSGATKQIDTVSPLIRRTSTTIFSSITTLSPTLRFSTKCPIFIWESLPRKSPRQVVTRSSDLPGAGVVWNIRVTPQSVTRIGKRFNGNAFDQSKSERATWQKTIFGFVQTGRGSSTSPRAPGTDPAALGDNRFAASEFRRFNCVWVDNCRRTETSAQTATTCSKTRNELGRTISV